MAKKQRGGAISLCLLTIGALGAGAVAVQNVAVVVDGMPVAKYETVTLENASPREHAVTVPFMPGWGYVRLGWPNSSYPTDRGLFVGPIHVDRSGPPTAIISVDRVDTSGREYADRLAHRMSRYALAIGVTDDEVCGRPAYRIDFIGTKTHSAELRSGTGIVVAPGDGFSYVAILQTSSLDHPSYNSERAALLDGFCVGAG